MILTKEELKEDSNWLDELPQAEITEDELPRAEITEDDSYENLASLFLGSLHVSYMCQTYNPQERIAKDNRRLVGEGGERGEFPDEVVEFTNKEMKKKPLGDIRNVLFYTKEQRELIDSVNSSLPTPTVIIGDYGSGKSVILESAATKFATKFDANDNDNKVHYLSALGWFIRNNL